MGWALGGRSWNFIAYACQTIPYIWQKTTVLTAVCRFAVLLSLLAAGSRYMPLPPKVFVQGCSSYRGGSSRCAMTKDNPNTLLA